MSNLIRWRLISFIGEAFQSYMEFSKLSESSLWLEKSVKASGRRGLGGSGGH